MAIFVFKKQKPGYFDQDKSLDQFITITGWSRLSGPICNFRCYQVWDYFIPGRAFAYSQTLHCFSLKHAPVQIIQNHLKEKPKPFMIPVIGTKTLGVNPMQRRGNDYSGFPPTYTKPPQPGFPNGFKIALIKKPCRMELMGTKKAWTMAHR